MFLTSIGSGDCFNQIMNGQSRDRSNLTGSRLEARNSTKTDERLMELPLCASTISSAVTFRPSLQKSLSIYYARNYSIPSAKELQKLFPKQVSDKMVIKVLQQVINILNTYRNSQ